MKKRETPSNWKTKAMFWNSKHQVIYVNKNLNLLFCQTWKERHNLRFTFMQECFQVRKNKKINKTLTVIILSSGQARVLPSASSIYSISDEVLHTDASFTFTTSTKTLQAPSPKRWKWTRCSGLLEDQRPSATITLFPDRSSSWIFLFGLNLLRCNHRKQKRSQNSSITESKNESNNSTI